MEKIANKYETCEIYKLFTLREPADPASVSGQRRKDCGLVNIDTVSSLSSASVKTMPIFYAANAWLGSVEAMGMVIDKS